MARQTARPKVAFNDVRVLNQRMRGELDEAIRAVIDDGRFELGREVYEFEAAFAAYCGVPHAVSVHSGTAALHMALLAMGIGPGDDVITVSNTDMSTVAAIRFTGGRPVLVDIEASSLNMDPRALAAAISPRTRAVIPVHMYGRPAEMTSIKEIARAHRLLVLEDAALSTGARYHDTGTGALGDAGAFSFAPGKVLGAFGWGGMITTRDPEIARRARMFRAYGEDPDQYPPPAAGFRFAPLHPEVVGWNVRIDTIQAAVLLVKLRHLEPAIEERRAIAARYRRGFAGLPVAMPDDPPHMRCVYRNVVVRLQHRDAVRRALYEAGIPTGTHYIPPVHLQPAYQDLGYAKGSLPETERAADELLTLPIYPGMPDGDVDIVIGEIARLVSR